MIWDSCAVMARRVSDDSMRPRTAVSSAARAVVWVRES